MDKEGKLPIYLPNNKNNLEAIQIQIRNNGGAFYGLQQEKAWNYGVSYRQLLLRGNQQADITLDYYITRFEKPGGDRLGKKPGVIQFYNVEGESLQQFSSCHRLCS